MKRLPRTLAITAMTVHASSSSFSSYRAFTEGFSSRAVNEAMRSSMETDAAARNGSTTDTTSSQPRGTGFGSLSPPSSRTGAQYYEGERTGRGFGAGGSAARSSGLPIHTGATSGHAPLSSSASSSATFHHRPSPHFNHRRGPMKDRYPPMSVDLADPRRRLAVLVDGTNAHLLAGLRGGSVGGGTPSQSADEAGSPSSDGALRNTALYTTILPAVMQVGVPVLLRVFAQQLSMEWEMLLAGGSGRSRMIPLPGSSTRPSSGSPSAPPDEADSTPRAAPTSDPSLATYPTEPSLQMEFFRVERFIPIPMQIEADAQHLYDFRDANQVQGVCYVCHEVDRAMYEEMMRRQRTGAPALSDRRGGGAATVSASSRVPPAAFFNQYLLDELGMVKEMNVDGRPGDGT